MPLIKSKSKKALSENIATEMDAGKPMDQSLAVAYSVKRKAKKKMSLGGAVEGEQHSGSQHDRKPAQPMPKPDDRRLPKNEYMDDHFAQGGSIADAIMQRRKMMAEGGMIRPEADLPEGEVDLESNSQEHQNLEDQLSYEALRKENYSEDTALEDLTSPMDSNEHGHDIDSDIHDMASKIRQRMRARRGM